MKKSDEELHAELSAILGGEENLKRVAKNARRDTRNTKKEVRLINRIARAQAAYDEYPSYMNLRAVVFLEARLWMHRRMMELS